MSRWRASDVPDQTGRTAVVTGPSRGGLGHHVALGLARRGARVVLAGRSPERLDETASAIGRAVAGAVTERLVVDLADLGSVRRAAAEAQGLGPLHVLVNNAGVMGGPARPTSDGLEPVMATNHFGPFLLTGLLLPQLVEGGSARVTTVSSLFHHGGVAPLGDPSLPAGGAGPYASSKLANLLFTRELERRARAAGLPLTATAAHPGYAGTGLFANAAFGRSRGGAASLVRMSTRVLGQAPSHGAWPVLMAATADLPGDTFCGPRALGGLRGRPKPVGRGAAARDDDAAGRLWELSEQVTGLSWP